MLPFSLFFWFNFSTSQRVGLVGFLFVEKKAAAGAFIPEGSRCVGPSRSGGQQGELVMGLVDKGF